MFHVDPVESFCNIDENLNFDLILALFDVRNGPKTWPLVHKLHAPESAWDPNFMVTW